MTEKINPPDMAEQIVEEEINLLELLQVIVSRKRMIIKCCAAAVILSVCYALTLQNIYTGTARILPPQQESGGGMAALLSQAGGLGAIAGGIGLGGKADLYMGILKSRSVNDAVAKRMELQTLWKKKNLEDTRNALKGLVKFQAGKDGIITITADYKDPQIAAKLANTFVEELGRRTVELNLSKAGNERGFLEKRLTVAKQELKTAEEEMKNFQEKYKAVKADTQAMAAIQGIANIKAQIVTNEAQLAALRSSMTDESPDVKKMLATIGRLKGQLAAMSGTGGDNAIPSIGNAPGIGMEYVRRLRELKIQEAVVEQLTKQYELAKINEARDSSTMQVLDEAVTPLHKSKPKRSQIVILSTVTAFFISIFMVFIQEYMSKLSPEDSATLREIRSSLLPDKDAKLLLNVKRFLSRFRRKNAN